MKLISRFSIFLLACLLLASSSNAQTVYKSIGPDGRTVYSENPPTEGKIVKTMKFDFLPSSEIPAAAAANGEQSLKSTSGSTAAKPRMDGVVLFSATWCGYCKKAKAYLAANHIAYQEFDIDTESGHAAFVHAGGKKAVPLLFVDQQPVQGFSPEGYDSVFANRK
jgi:glutaredoxin